MLSPHMCKYAPNCEVVQGWHSAADMITQSIEEAYQMFQRSVRSRVRHVRTMRPVLVGLCAFAIAACRDSLEPTPADEASQVASNTNRRGTLVVAADRDGEQLFRALAKVAPSSAGFYYDDGGTIIVRVKDPGDDLASTSFISELLNRNPGLSPGGGRRYLGIRVERAEYSFVELSAVRDEVSDELLGKVAGVFSVDLDERNNRIAVATEASDAAASSKASRVLALKAIDPRLIRFEAKQGSPFRTDFAAPTTLQSPSTDPLAGGLQIVRYGTSTGCTLGFVAQRNSVLGFVTASHCTSDFLWVDYSQFTQTPPSPIIGTETVDAPAYWCGAIKCRGSDAAFIESSLQLPMTVGKILRTTSTGSINVDLARPYFTAIYYQDDVLLGQIVDKVGITTGWTTGYVNYTCVDFYLWEGGIPYVVRCAAEGTYPADKGDSGAPIFVRVPGHPAIQGSELPGTPFWTDEFVALVGTHSGRAFGEKYFSKLGRIKSDLGGSWTVTAPVPPPPAAPLSVFIHGPVDVLSSPSCNLRYVAYATGGAWNTYSYAFTTDGTVNWEDGREVLLAFPSAGTHYLTVTVTDGNASTVVQTLEIVAGPSGMECQTG